MPIQPWLRRDSVFGLGVKRLKIYAGGAEISMESAPPA
jgi:hypothetical protein